MRNFIYGMIFGAIAAYAHMLGPDGLRHEAHEWWTRWSSPPEHHAAP